MDGLTCDLCDNELLLDDDVRYVVEVQVYAAYDPLELTPKDLRQDFRKKINQLIEKLKCNSAENVESIVYQAFTFVLCLCCQKRYIKNPLAKGCSLP